MATRKTEAEIMGARQQVEAGRKVEKVARQVKVAKRKRCFMKLREGFLLGSLVVIMVATNAISLVGQQDTLPPEIIAYPNLVFYNGKVLTADDRFTIHQAVAIRDGKFLKIGATNEVLALAGPKTQKIDLKGRTVTPGFYIHHLHLPDHAYINMLMRRDDIQWNGKFWPGMDYLTWDDAGSLYKDIEKVVAKSKPGEWAQVVAAFQAFPVLNQLRRSVLDAIAPHNPVLVLSPVAERVFAANTLALKLANILPETPRYPKGDEAMIRDEDAMWLLNVTAQWSVPMERHAAALKKRIAEHLAIGVTTLGGTRIMPTSLTALRDLWVTGELNMRWRLALMFLNADPNPERTLRNVGNLSDFGDDMLRISGMMMGAADGGTFDGDAWMFEPKKQELPGNPSRPYGRRGLNDPWPLRERDSLILRYGWSAAQSHSAGDRATAEFLSLFEEAKKNRIVNSPNQRLAIDHLVAVRPEDIKKFKELGVQPSISPWFVFKKEENADTVFQYGIERVGNWLPAKSYIDLGLKPDIEGDIAGLPYRTPLWNIGKMVSRKDDAGKVWNLKEKVSREQGLWMMTSWAARYNGDEKAIGSIEPGKLADLVVLGKDYMTVPEDEIENVPVVMTVVGGKVVYQMPGEW